MHSVLIVQKLKKTLTVYRQNSVTLGRFATPLNVSLINFEVLEVVTGPPIASLLSGSTVGPE